MLTISKPMSVKQADQYFKADDYYLSEKGEWQGAGAAALGLVGEVERHDFQSVLTGKDPDGGKALLHRNGGGDDKNIRGGIDLTFSAPKGVSILSLADPAIKDAHQSAVKVALEYLEKYYSHAREQVSGEREVTEHSNLTIAKFTHMVSRASDGDILPDPQLHTHAFVVNLIQTAEDEWKAHHNDAIYKDQLQLGRFYRAELSANLRELGYGIEITDGEKYLWDVKGVPEVVRDEFSKRRHQIEERTEELRNSREFDKANYAALREIANMQTRINKGKVSPAELMEHWKAALGEKGFTLEALHELSLREGALEKSKIKEPAEAVLRMAADIKTAGESVFTRGEIMDLAVRLSPPGNFRLGDLERSVSSLSNSGEFLFLGTIIEGGKRGTPIPRQAFTTKEMQGIELEILNMVRDSKNGCSPIVQGWKINGLIDRKEKEKAISYTNGQRELAATALTSLDRVNIIQGDAGTGKTAGLALVREIAEGNGFKVAGLGFTGKAAEELKNGAGIDSTTLDSFLRSKEKDKLLPGSILVLDEASMAGSRHFHELLKLAAEKDFKVLIVGDRKQFQSISAGRNHAILQDLAGVDQVRMNEVLRQKTKAAKEVVDLIAVGKTAEALKSLSSQGNLHQISKRDGRLDFVVNEYLKLRETRTDVLVLTATNSDRVELNSRIRNALVNGKQIKKGIEFAVRESTGIGAEQAAFAGSYKVGQKILFLKDVAQGKNLRGSNAAEIRGGSEAVIVNANNRSNSITIELAGQQREIPLKEQYQNFAVYDVEKRSFAPGDRVVFLRNDKVLGVKNGLQGTIKHLNIRGNVTVATDRGSEVRFRLSDDQSGNNSRYKYNYLAHSYALTEYKSQGTTTQAVIWHADASKGNINRNSFYVAATRAKESIKVITNDKEELKLMVNRGQQKTSTLDHRLGHGIGQSRGEQNIRGKDQWMKKIFATLSSPGPANKHEEIIPKVKETTLEKQKTTVSPTLQRELEKEKQIERSR